jgi:hypothetical protein
MRVFSLKPAHGLSSLEGEIVEFALNQKWCTRQDSNGTPFTSTTRTDPVPSVPGQDLN